MGKLHVNAIMLIIFCLSLVTFKHLQNVCSHDDINVSQNSSGAGCSASERRALMLFKASFVDNANRLSSWIGEDCCNWDGISCNSLTAHVVKLDLRNPIQPNQRYYPLFNNFDDYQKNCLAGELNPSLCDLKHLIYLDLSSNDFSRIQIPQCFGSLRNLRYLNLSAAGFEREIPPHLGNLSKLEHLDIGQSSFRLTFNSLIAKNLEWVARLSSLKSLDLSGINLSECVDWLDLVNLLPSLSSLTLSECELPAPGKLDSLLFPYHFNLTSLVLLDVGWNNMHYSALLFKFFNLLTDKLQVLQLESNNFGERIPSWFQRFTSLTVLDISWNTFNSPSLLNSLCNHSSLSYVDLSSNEFEGSIPVCLGNLTYLEVLSLGHNKLGGKIPSELGLPKQLVDLDLSDNSFNSCIPSSFGELSKLQELYVSYNQLTGEISELHFMKLGSLQHLELSENRFLTFNVSPNWIPPFQFRLLGMDGVCIGNQFPSWLRNQKNVVELYMANASISNTIPEWFGTTFSRVEQLDLSMNNMYDMLPLSMRNMKSLVSLNLKGNKFNGTLPEWIGELSQLKYVFLQSNNFHGMLPSSLKNLKDLEHLDLRVNQFNGIIPEWIGNEFSRLQDLRLRSNNFYGPIPSSLKNLKYLSYLDLSQNHFIGSLTEWIGKELSALETLNLQSNNFSGNIPSQLCQLPYLYELRLGNNNLTGQISDCFDL